MGRFFSVTEREDEKTLVSVSRRAERKTKKNGPSTTDVKPAWGMRETMGNKSVSENDCKVGRGRK